MRVFFLLIAGVWAGVLGACPEAFIEAAQLRLLHGNTLDQPALHEAMIRARAGDRAAQNDILTALAKVVPRQILARMRMPPERLDDVVQEVLFRVVRNNFDFDIEKGSYSTWMFWYIRACARIPQRKVEVFSASRLDDDETDFMASVADMRVEESTEELRAAQAAVGLLRSQDALIVREHLMEGVPQRELAEKLSLSTSRIAQLADRARLRLVDRVQKIQDSRFHTLLSRVELAPQPVRDVFIAVSLDEEGLDKPFCERMGFKLWKACVRAYFVAVGHMASDLQPEQLVSFWNGLLELPGPYRWVETDVVDHYLSTGEYPTETNAAAFAQRFEITVDRFFGLGVANPGTGPNSMRIFWGKEHALWMFHRFLERKEAEAGINSGRTWERLRQFNPFEWGRAKRSTPYRGLAQVVFYERLYVEQRAVVDAAIHFFREHGRLPHPTEELSALCGVHVSQLFSYGSEYQAGGRWEGFGVFSGVTEYEAILEARRVMLAEEADSPEEIALLRALGRARFTRLEYQSPLSAVFRYQYPVVSRHFGVMTPLEQRAFLLRAEQRLSDGQVSERLGVPRRTAELYCISGLARIEKHIRTQVNDEEARAFAKELLDLPGPHRETLLALVQSFGKNGQFPSEANAAGMLKEDFGFSSKKIIGSGVNVHAEKLHVRLFFGAHHFQWAMLEMMARERKALEAQGAPTAAARDRLKRYREWTIHQMDVAPISHAYTPLLLEFYQNDRDRELQRLANLALDHYLATGENPTGSKLIDLTGIYRERLFDGARQRADEGARKFFFDSREHYHQVLENAREARLMEGRELSHAHRDALEKLPLLMGAPAGEGQSPCEIPGWLEEGFSKLPQTHQAALCLHGIHGESRDVSAARLSMEPFAFIELYLSALNTLARHFERRDSMEELEIFLAWCLSLPGPQRDFTEKLIEMFGTEPTFMPTPERLEERVDWESVEFPINQLMGTGEYGPMKRLARVFFGPHHLMWAYDRLQTRPEFNPLASNWKRNGSNVYSRLLEARMEAYRSALRERAIKAATRVSPCPAPTEIIADELGITVVQLIGGLDYNRARPKGYLRIFDGQAHYDGVISRACAEERDG